ncbi:ATP-binding protein [Phenylobacterium sp.]|uniref:ATP-binding protein n=1 Tax=Phenylobacterium sp. TaxID=1871053 RepID=UPI0035B16CC7
MAALTAGYAAAMAHSLFLSGATHNLPTIWIPNAVAVAGLLVLPRRPATALLVIASVLHVALELLAGDPLKFALTITALDAAQVYLTAAVMRALRIPTRIRRYRGLMAIVGVSGVLTAATSIVVNGLLALSMGLSFWTAWSDWITANVLGVIIILPTLLILFDHRHGREFPATWLEVILTVTLTAIAAAALYRWAPDLQVLLFAPVLLSAFRGGLRAVALIVPASLIAAVPAVLARTGVEPALALPALRQAQLLHAVVYAVSLVSALALFRQHRLAALLARRTAAARAAEARARAASQAKSDFLATISHEIRTPLNSILGFTSLVVDQADLTPENQRRLELVGRAGRSLAEIVGDLLDFSKVEAGALELNLAPASPAAVLRDAVAIAAPAAEAKGVDLRIEIALEEAPRFQLDEARLRQVILNLLSNAVKFTPQGQVTARATLNADAGLLRFEVEDTGIGIAPEVQQRLFQRFTQADSSISRRFGGTGLGLAISRAFVTQMGGRIGVVSAQGEGSTFWIELPVQLATAEAAQQSPAQAAALSPDRAPQILLVDDHPLNRELGEAILVLAGCEVATAEDGAEAVVALGRRRFDLVLMDVHMPVMDGLAAARAIRAMPGPEARTPILALTADVLPEQIARCHTAGMNGHVAKPIDRDALIAAVAGALDAQTSAA